ncbi:MAG: ribosome biogenesis GTP-binding protein YihA/YsxC [Buchnera aphidicola (Meitanaphis flavogallis)]
MIRNNYCNTIFLKSIVNIKKEKYNFGFEFAFIGYSNSGKSTVINVLTNKKRLARVSKIPGRTQLINIFKVSSKIRLVDLPGYGYSKVSKNTMINLKKMVFQYLRIQTCLKGLIILMDIRYPMKFLDEMIINLTGLNQIPMLILLSKADKMVFSKQQEQLHIIRLNKLILLYDIRVELFSSFKKIGIDSLKDQLDYWIHVNV